MSALFLLLIPVSWGAVTLLAHAVLSASDWIERRSTKPLGWAFYMAMCPVILAVFFVGTFGPLILVFT